jgi:hypothetical protein
MNQTSTIRLERSTARTARITFEEAAALNPPRGTHAIRTGA